MEVIITVNVVRFSVVILSVVALKVNPKLSIVRYCLVLSGLTGMGRLLALTKNIRLGWQ